MATLKDTEDLEGAFEVVAVGDSTECSTRENRSSGHERPSLHLCKYLDTLDRVIGQPGRIVDGLASSVKDVSADQALSSTIGS